MAALQRRCRFKRGPRWYAWAWIKVSTPTEPGTTLLIVRNVSTGELAFYRCWTPTPVTLASSVKVAGIRWCVEESFHAAKGQVGLDHYQVRGWKPWHRFVTLAMLALAFLTGWPLPLPHLPAGTRITANA